MILTDYFLKKRLREMQAALPARTRHFCPLEEAGRWLLLYDARDAAAIAPCVARLRALHKEVTAFGLDLRREVTAWGFPLPEKVEAVRQIPADIVVDLSDDACHAIHYLSLSHPAPFRVGARWEGPDLYDLEIHLEEHRGDVSYLFEQILFYLQSIRAK